MRSNVALTFMDSGTDPQAVNQAVMEIHFDHQMLRSTSVNNPLMITQSTHLAKMQQKTWKLNLSCLVRVLMLMGRHLTQMLLEQEAKNEQEKITLRKRHTGASGGPDGICRLARAP